jgi:8-oxo-dGTP diphosphatase
VAAFVVRHAKAGDRDQWEGDDRLRPLSKDGMKQAEGLVKTLEAEPIDAILSSGYVRCRQSVEPLARDRKLPIETTPDLEEGAGGDRLLQLIARFKRRNAVFCTHGDVVEELLEILIGKGIVPRKEARLEKGSTWILEERDGAVTAARYLPAPSS